MTAAAIAAAATAAMITGTIIPEPLSSFSFDVSDISVTGSVGSSSPDTGASSEGMV